MGEEKQAAQRRIARRDDARASPRSRAALSARCAEARRCVEACLSSTTAGLSSRSPHFLALILLLLLLLSPQLPSPLAFRLILQPRQPRHPDMSLTRDAKQLRACLGCLFVQSGNDFLQKGCPNCDQVLQVRAFSLSSPRPQC